MANFSLEQLLRFTPYEAALISFNEQHGTQLNPRYVELTEVIGSEGPQVSLRLKAASIPPNSEENRFTNQALITIQRLDIGALFAGAVRIPYSGQIVSYDVGRILTQRSGIVFDPSDFMDQVLTPESNILKASPKSLRWYGQLTVLQQP